LDLITTWSTPEFTGVVPNFTLEPRTQEDFFYFQFDGYVNITTDGSYQFRTTSDDGSRLALNNIVIVENDGLHGDVIVTSATQTLSSGPYPINVKYFEYTGGQTLKVEYKGPDTGNVWKILDATALNSGTSTIFPARTALVAVELDEENNETLIVDNDALNLSVYPSPTTADNINVKVKSIDTKPVQVRLIDTMGRSMFDNSFSSELASEGVRISSKESLNGIYFILVNQGNLQREERVVIKN